MLGDRYLVERLVAEGGMGRVFEARRRSDGRRVAIKLLHRALASDERFRALMRREADALAAAAHPCVVGLIEQGESRGMPYLVLEWLEGRTLRTMMDDEGPLALSRIWQIMDPLLGALQWIHSRGVVHADLKPENIMLVGGADQLRLIDFGVASVGVLRSAWPGEVCGTPGYLAPEALSGAAPPRSADLYAAGAIFFELLTGTPPFLGSLTEIIAQQLEAPPPRPSEYRPGPCGALDAIVARALARQPEERYRSAVELRSAIALALHVPRTPRRRVPPGDRTVRVRPPRRSAGAVTDVLWG